MSSIDAVVLNAVSGNMDAFLQLAELAKTKVPTCEVIVTRHPVLRVLEQFAAGAITPELTQR